MKKILDISEYQKEIDFNIIKKNYDGVIIRVGYGNDDISQDDKCVFDFIKSAYKNKIPFGLYIYSYATDYDTRLSEVEHVKRVMNASYYPTLPVFIDIEENCCIPTINETIKFWCNEMSHIGVAYGVYSSASWYKHYIKDLPKGCVKWVAQYNNVCEIDNWDMWQFTPREVVGEIRCDLSYYDDNVTIKEIDRILHIYKENYGNIGNNVKLAVKNYWNTPYGKKFGSNYIDRFVWCLRQQLNNLWM